MDSKTFFDRVVKSNLSLPPSYSSVALGKPVVSCWVWFGVDRAQLQFRGR